MFIWMRVNKFTYHVTTSKSNLIAHFHHYTSFPWCPFVCWSCPPPILSPSWSLLCFLYHRLDFLVPEFSNNGILWYIFLCLPSIAQGNIFEVSTWYCEYEQFIPFYYISYSIVWEYLDLLLYVIWWTSAFPGWCNLWTKLLWTLVWKSLYWYMFLFLLGN